MRRFLLMAVALFAGLVSVWGVGRKSLSWSLDSMEVEGRGDSLAVILTWTFTDWEVESTKAMVFSPALRKGDLFASLTPVTVYGWKAAPQASRLVASGSYDEMAVTDLSQKLTIRIEDVIPRSEWMDTVKLTLEVSDWSKRDGLVLRSTSQRGMFVRPPRPDDFEFVWWVFEPKETNEPFVDTYYSMPVKFDGTSTKFDVLKQDLEEMETFLSKVKTFSSSQRFSIRASSFVLTVPPTGISKESVKLSRSRVASAYSYFKDKGCFAVTEPEKIGGGDDWDGVRDWVLDSRYRGDERLMQILSWEGKNDAKAGALRDEKPIIWDILQEQCFPGLGHIVYNVSFQRQRFTEPMFVQSYYDEVPEVLSAHDFWLLSTRYEKASPSWLDVICMGAELHPEDEELNLDAAFGLMECGRLNQAAEFLRNGGNDERARYGYAVWLYKSDRLDECIAIMDDLRRRSMTFGPILDKAVPFIKWHTNQVKWEPYYP